jgi:predicted membrane metal-binding protein
VIAIFVLPLVMDPKWATTIGFAMLFFMGLMGFLIGRSKDAQDDLRKLLR